MARPAKSFKHEILLPTLADYQEGYVRLHRAFAAISAVDAFAAHIYHEAVANGVEVADTLGFERNSQPNDLWFRNEIAKRHANFRLLRDAKKANEHAFLTLHNATVAGSGDTSPASKGNGEESDGAGRYGSLPSIFVIDTNGDEHDVESVVKYAVTLLDIIAEHLGLSV